MGLLLSKNTGGARSAFPLRTNGIVTILCGLVTILCLRGALVLDEEKETPENPYLPGSKDTPNDTPILVGGGSSALSNINLRGFKLEDAAAGGNAGGEKGGLASALGPTALALLDQGRLLAAPRLMVVTAEEPSTCQVAGGDKMALKSYKNKMDYCHTWNCKVFYSLEIWDNDYPKFWRKAPILKGLMKAHPEIEWFMWMDSDAMFTDFSFAIPLDDYNAKKLNAVFPGTDEKVYEEGDWCGLNAGVFLIRNNKWAHEFLAKWMDLGRPESLVENGKMLSRELSNRQDWEADDQSALVWLLRKYKSEWEGVVRLENDYALHGYWEEFVEKLDEFWKNGNVPPCNEGFICPGRWPFITHFAGCKLCSGEFSEKLDKCLSTFDIAYNFGDNQVLKRYKLQHKNLRSINIIRAKRKKSSDKSSYEKGSSGNA